MDVAKKVLNRFLGAVIVSELYKNSGLEILWKFVIKSFRKHYNSKNIKAIKALDSITKDLLISLRSSKNIANFLNVSFEFEFCFISYILYQIV